jgi:TadE-like protein
MKAAKQARSTKSRSSPTAAQTRREAGAAAVEFVFVLPILLALVFGIVNYGFIFASQISLNSAARDAARAGVVNPLSGSAMSCLAIAKAGRANSLILGNDSSLYPDPVEAKVKNLTTGVECTLPSGSSPASITNGLSLLCASTGGQISVELRYIAHAPVPYVPPSAATLTATGVFQCEYL